MDINATLLQLVQLQNELTEAKKEHAQLHAKVKHHHNTVYGPMCEAKKEAKIRVQELEDAMSEMLKGNETLIELMRKLVK